MSCERITLLIYKHLILKITAFIIKLQVQAIKTSRYQVANTSHCFTISIDCEIFHSIHVTARVRNESKAVENHQITSDMFDILYQKEENWACKENGKYRY